MYHKHDPLPGIADLGYYLDQRFECPQPEIRRLLIECYDSCILGRMREPTPPLPHPWPTPGWCYMGQWVWDTMFVLDLMAVMPELTETIRNIWRNYWDAQDRWDASRPDYAHGMITNTIKPTAQERPNGWHEYSQIPILAWGMQRVYQRNGDRAMLEEGLPRLRRFHDWYWRERDVRDMGLCTVGAYSGDVQDGRFETFDFEPCLDDLQFTEHPTDKSRGGKFYGDICLPGITAYLIDSERCLQQLAEEMGDTDLAGACARRVERGVAAMRQHMWDEQAGTFLAVHRDTLEKVRTPTIGSWIPLMAGVPTEAQARRMAEVLATPEWLTGCPVPTVGRTDPHFNDGHLGHGMMWRGDAWPPTTYQVVTGLHRYGHDQLAGDICDRMIDAVIRYGFNERYEPDQGKPIGVPNLGMSCAALTMVLDGRSAKWSINPRRQQEAAAGQ